MILLENNTDWCLVQYYSYIEVIRSHFLTLLTSQLETPIPTYLYMVILPFFTPGIWLTHYKKLPEWNGIQKLKWRTADNK